MARNDSSRPSGANPAARLKLSAASAHVLSEWRGCEEPADLRKGLHTPAEFIHAILEAAGASDGLHEDEVRLSWKDAVGDFIAAQTEPVSLKQGQLLVRVSQPALRFQLESMKPRLISRLASVLGQDKVRSIRFSHG